MSEISLDIDGQTHACQVVRKATRRFVLKVTPTEGLRCHCPTRASDAQVLDFIKANESWLKKQAGLLALSQQFQAQHHCLPEQLRFAFDDTIFAIEYSQAHRSPRIQVSGKTLQVYSNGRATKIRQLLKAWMVDYANTHLGERMDDLSRQHQLPFSGLSIGFAKLRWGSCRHDKAIRLNPLLLFLPRAVAEHVMLHELCHTVHHNHSKAFWALLASLDPDTDVHKRFLRNSSEPYAHIPVFFWPS